ncbi:MAG: hypothetical protein DI539_16135, partial [Flavobacterium psychrophilum]
MFFLALSCNKPKKAKSASNSTEDSLIAKVEEYTLDSDVQVKYLDSAYQLALDRSVDTVSQNLLKKITIAYYNRDLYDKSITSGKKLYSLSVSLKDTLAAGRALFYVGESFYGLENNDSAFWYYKAAEKLNTNFNGTGDRALGEIILYKAYVYYDAGEFALCESEAFKAEKYLRLDNKATDLYNCYNLIALALDGQENNKDAIRYYQKAFDVIDNFKKEGYSDSQIALNKASCYNNMGGV